MNNTFDFGNILNTPTSVPENKKNNILFSSEESNTVEESNTSNETQSISTINLAQRTAEVEKGLLENDNTGAENSIDLPGNLVLNNVNIGHLGMFYGLPEPAKNAKSKVLRTPKQNSSTSQVVKNENFGKENWKDFTSVSKLDVFEKYVKPAYISVASGEKYKVNTNSGKTNGGEVYTPSWAVIDMLKLIPDDKLKYDSQSLDPCCGTGNITIGLFARKLVDAIYEANDNNEVLEHNLRIAIRTLHAVDINPDSVKICQVRLYDMFKCVVENLKDILSAKQQYKLLQYGLLDLSYAIAEGNTLDKNSKCIANYADNLENLYMLDIIWESACEEESTDNIIDTSVELDEDSEDIIEETPEENNEPVGNMSSGLGSLLRPPVSN